MKPFGNSGAFIPLAFLILISGCSGPPEIDSISGLPGEVIPVEAQAEFTVDACQGQASSSEPCYWRYAINVEKCSPLTPCNNLVLIFSGGEMHCDETYGGPTYNDALGNYTYENAMKYYADRSYVAVCAGIFFTSSGHAGLAFNLEAERINTLVNSIRDSAIIKKIWNGKNLFFTGISHGATAPVIAMARSNYDDTPSWKGSVKTGACFLDGIYNIPDWTNNFLMNAAKTASAPYCALLHNGTCARYGLPDTCLISASDWNSNPNIGFSTLTQTAGLGINMDPSSFAIKNWKLLECGSDFHDSVSAIENRCALLRGDTVSAEPISDLCALINSKSADGYYCDSSDLTSLSGLGHGECFAHPEGLSNCSDFFDSL